MTDQPTDINDEAMVAFVRGRMARDAAQGVAKAVEADPKLAAELAFARGIAAALDAEASATPSPGALGWARLSRAIDAESSTAAPLRRWLPGWQTAAAAAAAVLLWQVIAVPFIMPDGAGFEPVGEAVDASVSVAFAADAPEGEIRALLRSVSGRVTDGPSALGLWQVSFEDETARDAALAALEAAPIVASATMR